jgi:hypothetical protein
LLLLVVLAPSAGAATLGDGYIPDAETLPGVTVTVGKQGERSLRFGAKAAKVYRTLAGKRATYSCAVLENDDGWLRVDAGTSQRETLPRRANRVIRLARSTGVDVCALSTKRNEKRDVPCSIPSDNERECVRVIVALTDAGRTYLDAKKRAIELFVVATSIDALAEQGRDLQKVFGDSVVALASPDASPPVGKVGYIRQPNGLATASLLASGERAFLSIQNGVYSTNVPDLMGPGDHAFELI